jgi:hypothetical protein
MKKDSSSRVSNINAVQGIVRESDATGASQVVPSPAAQTNAAGSFSNNGYDRGGNGNRFNSRGRGGSGAARRSTVPQWVIDYCRNNKLCFNCKQPFTPETHPPGTRCARSFQRLDPKLRPQSN